MSQGDRGVSDQFISELTEIQLRLKGYISAALGDYVTSQDVLQKTNLTIWAKADDFREGSEFLPWALGIARYQILAYFRDQKRDRLTFSPELSETLADLAEREIHHMSERQAALQECLKSLPLESRKLIFERYNENHSIDELSSSLGKSVPAVKSLLFRLRSRLAKCVEWRLRSAMTRK